MLKNLVTKTRKTINPLSFNLLFFIPALFVCFTPTFSYSDNSSLIQPVFNKRLDFFRSRAVYSPSPSAEGQEHEEVDRVFELFTSHKAPFLWWSANKKWTRRGFDFGGIFSGVTLDISKEAYEEPTLPNLTIKIAKSEKEIRVFFDLLAREFGLPKGCSEQIHAVTSSLENQKNTLNLLAYVGKTPVGGIILSMGPVSAGIWSLAVYPNYRSKGIGRALTQAALLEAQKNQYNQVIAVLMPKAMAWDLFESLGFEKVCEFPFSVYGMSS